MRSGSKAGSGKVVSSQMALLSWGGHCHLASAVRPGMLPALVLPASAGVNTQPFPGASHSSHLFAPTLSVPEPCLWLSLLLCLRPGLTPPQLSSSVTFNRLLVASICFHTKGLPGCFPSTSPHVHHACWGSPSPRKEL